MPVNSNENQWQEWREPIDGSMMANSRKNNRVNARSGAISAEWTFGKFVSEVYFPFYERKWKHSTLMCNKHRITFHLCSEFAAPLLESFRRDELQDLLDRKADLKLSFSTVDHLRWDLSQIFEMAVSDGFTGRTRLGC